MIEQDTIKLYRECDAGVKMGISSLTDVTKYIGQAELLKIIGRCRDEHLELEGEIRGRLNEYGDEGKNPNPIAKGMSWMKTNVKLAINESDSTIASLITDGCDMGVKSLSKYLNQYAAAEEHAKDTAKKLIAIEDRLSVELRAFL